MTSPVTPTPITSGPTVPNIGDPEATFDSMLEAFHAWQKNNLQPEINTIATQTYANAVAAGERATEAASSASAASSSASASSSSASAAAASASSALNAPGTSATSATSLTVGIGSKSLTIQTGKAFAVGQTVVIASSASPTNQMTGLVTAHNNTTGALTVDVERADGSGTYASWTVALTARPIAGLNASGQAGKLLSSDGTNFSWIAVPQSTMGYATRTSNTALTTTDLGKFINISGSGWTQTLQPAATLGAGWYCYLRCNGTAKTIDPSGSETIDGVTTGRIVAGQIVLIVCDGTNFQAASIHASPIVEVLTSGTSWACPVGIRSAVVQAVGGGGNGSGVAAAGGGGGTAIKRFSTTPATTYTYAIGAAGASASNGGDTTFSDGTTTITASGGLGGYSVHAGGAATGGDINIRGQSAFGSSPYMGGGSTLGTGGYSSQQASGYGGGNAPNSTTPTQGVVVITY